MRRCTKNCTKCKWFIKWSDDAYPEGWCEYGKGIVGATSYICGGYISVSEKGCNTIEERMEFLNGKRKSV